MTSSCSYRSATVVCPSGYQAVEGATPSMERNDTACKHCPAGTYSDGAYNCTPCPAGFIDSDNDPASVCIPCNTPGYYIPPGSNGSCTDPKFECAAAWSLDVDNDPSTACIGGCSITYVAPSMAQRKIFVL